MSAPTESDFWTAAEVATIKASLAHVHPPRLVPYPNVEQWFVDVAPPAEAGACDYCPAPATVVVENEAWTCPEHVMAAVLAIAEDHGYGHLITVDAFVEPLAPIAPVEWVEVH